MKNKNLQIAIDTVKKLKKDKRYLAGYIFGSVARGDATKESDLDVKVIVENDNCENINHPFISGIKLDITFLSFRQLEELLQKQAKKAERVPMLVESIILFDKTGELKKLKQRFQKIKPKKYSKDDYQLAQFMVYHADNKVSRALDNKDYLSAQLGMHVNLTELLKTHYHIKGKWWASDKRLMADLKSWDKNLFKILSKYLTEKDIKKKYKVWSQIIDYILKPIGGRQNIEENNCDCVSCKRDLANLLRV